MYSLQNSNKAFFNTQNENIEMFDESPEDNNDNMIYDILNDEYGASGNK